MLIQNSQETAIAVQIIGAAVVTIIGGWSQILEIFVIMICLDYAAGTLRAAKNGQLNSTVGFMGLLKKTGYFVVIAMFFQLGTWVGSTNADALFVRGLIVNLFIMNEAVSVLENIRYLGGEDYLPHGVVELLEGILADDIRQNLKDLPGQPES